MSKYSVASVLKYSLYVFILVFFAIYVTHNIDNFKEISLVSPWLIVPASFAYICNIYGTGQVVDQAIKPHGVRVSRMEIFGLSALTRFVKMISPGYFGAAVRAVYLKKKYNLSYTSFSASLGLSTIIQFIIAGIIAISILLTKLESGTNLAPFIFIFSLLFIFAGVLYLPTRWLSAPISKLHAKWQSKITDRAIEAVGEFDNVRKSPTLFIQSVYWMVFTLGASSLMLFTLYTSIGEPVDIFAAIFINCLTSWTMLFELTPASLGIREGLMVFGAGIMGVSIPATIAVALIMRLVNFAIVSALALYFSPKLLETSITKIDKVNIHD